MCRKSALFILLWTLAACSTGKVTPQTDRAVEIPKLLTQVSEALNAAREEGGDQAPIVTSVQLDLQVATTTDLKTQMPILFFVTSPSVGKESVHRMSVTFQPQIEKLPKTAGKPKYPELTETLKSLFKSLSKTGDEYLLQKGSVQIQCTFNNQINFNTTPTVLIPAKAELDNSKQTMQTLTLNFSPNPAAVAHATPTVPPAKPSTSDTSTR